VPAKIVIGFDGTDSGEDALALGLLLARSTGAVPLVAVIHAEEYPIGVGRVDAEWVAYLHEQAEGERVLAGVGAVETDDDLGGHGRPPRQDRSWPRRSTRSCSTAARRRRECR
jgi:hypothetical protein